MPTGKQAIVIGSGPLGAIASRRLVENGLKVTLVEAGQAITDPPGNHFRNAARFQSAPDAYLPEIMPHFQFYDKKAPEAGLPGASVTWVYGGQGIFWTNNCPRATPEELWPLPGHASWDALYQSAESYLSVRSDQFLQSKRGQRILPRLQELLQSAKRQAMAQPMAGWLTPDRGIHYTATADILAPVQEDSIRHITGMVERILLKHNRACGVVVDGREHLADVVFVACGAIDTTRLLMRSGIGGPALGRHLTFHPVLIAQVVLDPSLRAPNGVPDLPPRLQIPPTPGASWNTMVLRDTYPMPPHPDDVGVEENALVEMQMFCPVENRPGNRMEEVDGKLRFDVPLSKTERERMDAMRADSDAIAKALGRYRRGCEAVWLDLGFAHLMGACRIGEDPADSVVDGYCRPHGTDNLYLNTVGVIPTPMAVNPTLTAAALTVHAVDHYLSNT